jgi:hypothetical protein
MQPPLRAQPVNAYQAIGYDMESGALVALGEDDRAGLINPAVRILLDTADAARINACEEWNGLPVNVHF